MSSPLLLERHVFKRVELIASDKPDPGALNLLNYTLSCAKAQGDPSHFLIALDLKLLAVPDSDKIPSYTGSILIEGQFRVAAEIAEERRQIIAIANGAGILFGAIREMILGITARGPWPPLMLTTVNFIEMAKKMAAQPSAATPEKPEKGATQLAGA